MSHPPPPAWAIRTKADRQALKDGCYWDQAAADRIIRFAEKYVAPKFTQGAFSLFPWQIRFLQSLYGWRQPDGTRRFRWAVLHVPKKNGKTLLVSILAAYELFAAGEPSPLVASASTAKENAKQVYEQVCATIDKQPALKKIAKQVESKFKIFVKSKDAEFRSLSAEARTHEGANCSAVIVDEAHAHRSPALFNCLRYSTAGRPNGIVVVISTAGDDLTHFYAGFVERARNVLKGDDLDPTFYAEVYEADPEKDDLDDPAVWKRCNPSLDLYPGFTSANFAGDLASAKPKIADWLNFQRYRLNIFRRPEEGGWVDLAQWDQRRDMVPESELLAAPCWLAFDGSQTTDPSSVSAVWLLPGRRYFARSWAWVASEGVRHREQTNLPRYQQFAAEGVLTITEGNVIDKWAIREHIRAMRTAGHQVQMIVMDGSGYTVFGTELETEDGFQVFRMPQNMEHFADPTREFNEAVLAGTLLHDGNTWLRWCVNSVRLATDSNGRSRPVRRKSVDKIDGAIATLMAFSQAYRATAPDPNAGAPPAVFLV
ncbi:Uncultured bacterium genome assembly Metasoil_fosmids_resub OS=uncultured bacterium PE=4 SV=1: Terminase_1 [Gemmata massiliana]|uniref:Terminase large subunit n=1 Tax=Gemmata massiliana TaxID=1210884 RepID=A0A6P2D6X6_9BACT|nr:terminase large subunit [Gemmata massiliana]VTR95232.1 Uncultured bacterium genome assembly Metasoil_fosmids_resub OS=uncultured bacterium PE=4 SV=1: Terminase_1 [Gemmata massiliana]